MSSSDGSRAREPKAKRLKVEASVPVEEVVEDEVAAVEPMPVQELYPGPEFRATNALHLDQPDRYNPTTEVPYDRIPEIDSDVDIGALFSNRIVTDMRSGWEVTGWAMYDTRLGFGAFGAVYLGFKLEDVNLPDIDRRYCAFKVTTVISEKEVWNELTILRCLSHANLCRLFDSFLCEARERTAYLVLEYCDAGIIADEIEEAPSGKLPEGLARHYFRQIVSGIMYMHDKGIAHCDLHGGNVMLNRTADGTKRCIITDFGMAEICWEKAKRPPTPYAGTPPPLTLPDIEYRSFSHIFAHLDNMLPELTKMLFVRPTDQQTFIVEGWNYLANDVHRLAALLCSMLAGIQFPDRHDPTNLGQLDTEADAFIRAILLSETEDRITIHEVWDHPWTRMTVGHPQHQGQEEHLF